MAGKKKERRYSESCRCRACGHDVVHPDDRPGTDATLHTLPRVRDEATGRLKRKRSKCETFERDIRAMERTSASFFRDEKAARAAARRLDAVAKRWLRGHGALGAKAVPSEVVMSEVDFTETAEGVPRVDSAA